MEKFTFRKTATIMCEHDYDVAVTITNDLTSIHHDDYHTVEVSWKSEKYNKVFSYTYDLEVEGFPSDNELCELISKTERADGAYFIEEPTKDADSYELRYKVEQCTE